MQKCEIIDAPPRRKRAKGWFQSIPPRPLPAGHEMGQRWEAAPCHGPDPHSTEACGIVTLEDRVEKPSHGAPYREVKTCLNVSLVGSSSCKAVGDLAHSNYQTETIQAGLEERVRDGAAYTLGLMLSTGKAWEHVIGEDGCPTGDRVEADWDLVDKDGDPLTPWCAGEPEVLCAGDALGPRGLVSAFENAMPDCTVGQMTIYLPAMAAAFMVGACGPVFPVGNGFETALGTPVVFGWGFTGAGPDGEPVDDPGQAWAWMLPETVIHRSGLIETDDGDIESTLNRGLNDRDIFVEEDFTVGFADDCCPLAAVGRFCD